MVAYSVMILNVHLIQPYYLSKYVKSLDMSSSFFFSINLPHSSNNPSPIVLAAYDTFSINHMSKKKITYALLQSKYRAVILAKK